jgi:hypothetical protein
MGLLYGFLVLLISIPLVILVLIIAIFKITIDETFNV